MNTIPYSQRYLPHDLSTRYHSCRLYRSGYSCAFVCRRYHISRSSLMRWNKRFNGTKESLIDIPHTPHSKHPNSHTDIEIKWIKDFHKRNPNESICYMYGQLKTSKGYSRHPGSLYRICSRLGYTKQYVKATNKPEPKKYHTPCKIGVKWQMDVKYVPKSCYTGQFENEFYQYTVIDEASRERFIYAYQEQSSYSTVDFLYRAFQHFGYVPLIIQTDNGPEFTHLKETKRVHPLDLLCDKLDIKHQLIRPRTPKHNGKVERSHRIDQERFYNYLKFYSLKDLQNQMARYLYKYNHTLKPVLNWKSPFEKRCELINISNDIMRYV